MSMFRDLPKNNNSIDLNVERSLLRQYSNGAGLNLIPIDEQPEITENVKNEEDSMSEHDNS